MYEKYWGLKEKPFENTPDPRFFYSSARHEEALMRMLYAVRERKGAALLTGDFGSGKTVISRVMLRNLGTSENPPKTVIIVNPAISFKELLWEIVYQLDGRPIRRDSKAQLLKKLEEELRSNLKRGRHCVIVVDEAQAISEKNVFEELRLLLNFQHDDRFLLTLVLMGQPELARKVARIKQLEQRMSIRYHLTGLNRTETEQYVRYRCTVAGGPGSLFGDDTYLPLYEASDGIPREINNICDLCLVTGFGKGIDSVSAEVVEEVVRDVRRGGMTDEDF